MFRSAQHDSLGRRAGRQLEFAFQRSTIHLRAGRDVDLESKARELLRQLGADKLAREIRVEWNPRMRSAAGRADFREKLVSLNPLLREHEEVSINGHSGRRLAVESSEIDRTL